METEDNPKQYLQKKQQTKENKTKAEWFRNGSWL